MTERFDGALLGGRWRLGPRLGAGGQGRTFLARDERRPVGAAEIVVAKQVRLGGDSGWKRFDLLEREVRVLRSLDHPGVPRLLDHLEEPAGTFTLIMTRAPGDSLRDAGRRRRFDEAQLVDVLDRTLAILSYLHRRRPPVIHRDVKPANLVRADEGTVTLVDFGGVLEALRDDGGSTMVGTYGYMAPEQLHGQATPATDLYGLGATIVALAGGVEPEKVPRRGLRMDLGRHLPGLDPTLRGLLEKMTDPDPGGRPGSADEARLMLRAPKPAVVPIPAAQPTPPAPARAPAPGDREDDLFDFHDGSIPGPLRFVLRLAMFVTGVAGLGFLTAVDLVLVPFFFAVARAFAGRERAAKLRATERSVRGLVREGRAGFRAMTRRGLRGRRRGRGALPVPPPPPRRLGGRGRGR